MIARLVSWVVTFVVVILVLKNPEVVKNVLALVGQFFRTVTS